MMPYVPLGAITGMKLLGFIFFGLMVYGGYLNKLYGAALTLFMTLFAALVSLSFFQPLGQLFMHVASWSEKLAYGVVMVLLFLGTYVCCYALAMATLPSKLDFHKYVDAVGGAVLGALTGIVFSGFMLVALYLFPLAGFENEKYTWMNVDHTVVKLAALVHDRIPGRDFDAGEFLHWAKTVNQPTKKQRPVVEEDQPGYPRRRGR